VKSNSKSLPVLESTKRVGRAGGNSFKILVLLYMYVLVVQAGRRVLYVLQV
jgi:hypothetical protein